MGKFNYIVQGIRELVSEENRDTVQEIFDKEFNVLSKYFDTIYEGASIEQLDEMKMSFVSFLLDKLIKDNKSMEKRSSSTYWKTDGISGGSIALLDCNHADTSLKVASGPNIVSVTTLDDLRK